MHCRGSVGKLKAIFEKSKYLFPFEYKSIKIIFIRSRIRKETKLWQRSINIGDLLQQEQLTAAAAGAIAALVSRRSVCEEDFEDDFEDLDDFKDDEKKEEKEEKEVFQDWDKTASETVEVSKEAEDAEEAPTEAEEETPADDESEAEAEEETEAEETKTEE